MSLYNDLTDVLTPYANKIKEVNESLVEVSETMEADIETTNTHLAALQATVTNNKTASDAKEAQLQNAINSKVSIVDIRKTGSELLVDTYTITMSNGSTYTFTVTNGNDASNLTVEEAVGDWLDNHPEATTTVLNGSITTAKLAEWAVPFVYPEQFGAVGDGATDDAAAIQAAINHCVQTGKKLVFMPKTYGIIPYQEDKTVVYYNSNKYALLIKGGIEIDLNGAVLQVLTNEVQYFDAIGIRNAEHVIIKNGTIIGDRLTHTLKSDNSQLINVFDSKYVLIDNVLLKDSKGDCLGFSGVQIGQPNTAYAFDDFYMGNVLSNCVLSHSVRHGMTLSKGRGITIRNCHIENVQPEGVISYNGNAVDMEPYYGYGSVFDIRFVDCSMINNAGSPLIQSSDGVRFLNCYIQGIGFRSAENCMISNCVVLGGMSSRSSSVKANNCFFGGIININNEVDTTHGSGELRDNVIINCIINGGFTVNTRNITNKMGKIVLSSCDVKAYNNTALIIAASSEDLNVFESITVDNNNIKAVYSASATGGIVLSVVNTNKFIFKNNDVSWDAIGIGQTGYVAKFDNVETVRMINNVFSRLTDQEDVTYTTNMRKFCLLSNMQNNALFRNNTVNVEGNVLSSLSLVFLGTVSSSTPINAILIDNYLNGFTSKVESSDLINLLADSGNVVNNNAETLLPAEGVTF